MANVITFKHKGDFSKTMKFFEHAKQALHITTKLEKYAQAGVDALAAATPVDSGVTAASWYYEITEGDGWTTIAFNNSNINKGVSIALILQYGHGTRNGGYVQGRDYINPAIRPIFDKLADEAWEEVTKS